MADMYIKKHLPLYIKIKIFEEVANNPEIQSYSDISALFEKKFGDKEYKCYQDPRNAYLLINERSNGVPTVLVEAVRKKTKSWLGTYVKYVDGVKKRETTHFLLTGLIKCGYHYDKGRIVALRYKPHRLCEGYRTYVFTCRLNDEVGGKNRNPVGGQPVKKYRREPVCEFSVNPETGRYDKIPASKIEKEVLIDFRNKYKNVLTKEEKELINKYLKYIEHDEIYKIISDKDPDGFIAKVRDLLSSKIKIIYIYNDRYNIIWKEK